MKTKKPTISFFCPAYYDESNLPLLIPKAIKTLKKHTSKFEVVIIEDGSPDKTAEVADKLALKFQPYVRVIHHKKNLGYGGALKSGFKNANKYDYVFYTDGDMQYDVAELSKLIPHLKKYDIVIGFRSKRALKFIRLIQTKIYNLIVRMLFGLKVKDINCSMKIIKRKILNRINLTSKQGFIDAELLIKLEGHPIKEVEVSHFSRLFGKASGGSLRVVLGTFFEMAKLYFRKKIHRSI